MPWGLGKGWDLVVVRGGFGRPRRSAPFAGIRPRPQAASLRARPFPVHYGWLPAGRWDVECLTNLDAVPEKGAHLALGRPGRVIALA
ncbi:hypothetical protein RGI145_15045 [Roseomonas gilardii]|uniref:Uncharacterized protein n=1 Tax=Roseomonas gilardii TaxID=257708 RepID=A0A1L7AHL8_9PROT|nr:hypothetical protein [Roseomonas gilardii]APT58231.1 hypothetical protein RGI145_15045 [Roseomonas gilardii]